jgi:hypothetical protein
MANKALINAAPELLEACKYALEWIKRDLDKMDPYEWGVIELERVIAKAEGKGE